MLMSASISSCHFFYIHHKWLHQTPALLTSPLFIRVCGFLINVRAPSIAIDKNLEKVDYIRFPTIKAPFSFEALFC